jgi:hypothetical protein
MMARLRLLKFGRRSATREHQAPPDSAPARIAAKVQRLEEINYPDAVIAVETLVDKLLACFDAKYSKGGA